MRFLTIFCVFAMLLLALTGVLYGQAVTGSLLGTITDSSGGAVPSAKVTITETKTGIGRNTEANDSGNYSFPSLEQGTYRVAAERTGFRVTVREAVDLLVNTAVRVDLVLQPGQVNETVTVTTEAALLQTDRSDTGRKIEAVQVANIPLGYNRNFQGLLNLVPGTSRAFQPHSEFFNSQSSLATQVNGVSRMGNNVQFEGVDNNHRTGLLTALIPPIEALETVDVSTSNYEAELGRAGGAVTNIMLKSGTNELHGSAYWSNNVSALGARDTFQPKKPVTTYNYYGVSAGGPVIKNKMFLFGDFLQIKDRRGDGYIISVPVADFRAGNFSSQIGKAVIYDPTTGNNDTGAGRLPFAGNIIPASQISPIAQKLMAMVPLPNFGANINQNYASSTTRNKDYNSFDVKYDYQMNDANRLSAR